MKTNNIKIILSITKYKDVQNRGSFSLKKLKILTISNKMYIKCIMKESKTFIESITGAINIIEWH